jgi:hypothetical protein
MFRFVILGFVLGVGPTVDVTTQNMLELSCTAIGPNTTSADLAARFGSANVVDGAVYVGEGFSEPGTVLFGDVPERRAEIVWRRGTRQGPRFMRVRGEISQWRTPQGLTLGLDLSQVERLNRRPFRLRGFGWDSGGRTTSWSGGVLAEGELPPCTIWARFSNAEERLTTEEARLFRQVQGERDFSSGHPGVQAAHARVWQIGLTWRH